MIEVTQADIDAGGKTRSDSPIALAVNRCLGARDAYVEHAVASVGDRWFPLPGQAALFIRDFVRGYGRHAHPFSFEADFSKGGEMVWHD